jgi:hypothetical protein
LIEVFYRDRACGFGVYINTKENGKEEKVK